jgi:hypothetical protein
MKSAAFSATIIVGALRLAFGITGNMDASAILRFLKFFTLKIMARKLAMSLKLKQ